MNFKNILYISLVAFFSMYHTSLISQGTKKINVYSPKIKNELSKAVDSWCREWALKASSSQKRTFIQVLKNHVNDEDAYTDFVETLVPLKKSKLLTAYIAFLHVKMYELENQKFPYNDAETNARRLLALKHRFINEGQLFLLSEVHSLIRNQKFVHNATLKWFENNYSTLFNAAINS